MPTTSLIKDVSIATGIDSAKIGAGDVSNAEHAFLNSITSNVQTQIAGAGVAAARNDVTNGGYLVNQENNTSATDDAYSIGDLFNYLGEAAATTSLQTSSGPQGDRKFSRINIDTANKQAGWIYFLSTADVQDYIANGKLSFGVKIKTVTSKVIGTVRIGILKWTGTADSVTSDVVGTWAQDGTNPTLATSWSYENTPADINITTSWVRYTVEDITVDSDTNNIGIFIWIDDGTIAQNDQLDITEWQLNPGSTVDDFSSPSISVVKNEIDYYLHRFDMSDASDERIAQGSATATALIECIYNYSRRMRGIPTITQTAITTFTGRDSASTVTCDSMNHNTIASESTNLLFHQAGTTWTVGQAAHGRRNLSQTAWIQFDSRL